MKNHSRSDILAPTIAHDLHDLIEPLATILFGSRARGDHRPDSDLDILLIQDTVPNEQEFRTIEQQFQALIDRLYPTKVKAHLTSIDVEHFTEEEPYFNSLVSRALLGGTTISGHPERFTSRYGAQEPPPPIFLWDYYQDRLRNSRENLKVVHIAVANHDGDIETRESIRFNQPWEFPIDRGTLTLDKARSYLGQAMQYALAAAIDAKLGIIKPTDRRPDLFRKLQLLAPTEDLSTTIPAEAYGGLDAITWDRKAIQDGITDVENIRKIAMRLRRQTARSAKAKRTSPD